MGYLKELLPKIIRYRMARFRSFPPGMPFNLTFSITNACQSRCKTCNIWELYRNDPEKRKDELTLDEINRIFHSMGHIYIFNISGGEPFLRNDIKEIIESACRYLSPGIIHIPTNALSGDTVRKKVIEILKMLQDDFPGTRLTVKPSLDHINEKHDEIRGVPGNFKKVMTLFNELQTIQPDFPDFHAELGTVISKWNVNDIEEIAGFVKKLGADSYRNEIAEQRSEMFNMDHSITPSPDDYQKAIGFFVGTIRNSMKDRNFFQKITNAFRLVYYDLAISILKSQKQVIPCYAGISNAHMTPYGDVWACCTLGYDKPMGNLRENNYNFKKVWNSRQAEGIRRYIKSMDCYCPMANQTYSNMLLHAPSFIKVLREIFISK